VRAPAQVSAELTVWWNAEKSAGFVQLPSLLLIVALVTLPPPPKTPTVYLYGVCYRDNLCARLPVRYSPYICKACVAGGTSVHHRALRTTVPPRPTVLFTSAAPCRCTHRAVRS